LVTAFFIWMNCSAVSETLTVFCAILRVYW